MTVTCSGMCCINVCAIVFTVVDFGTYLCVHSRPGEGYG